MVDAHQALDRENHAGTETVPRFLVGRDSRGRWVVLDQWHLSGGLFIGRTEAIRYAMFESGRRPQAVIMVPGIIEADMTQSFVTAGQQGAQCEL